MKRKITWFFTLISISVLAQNFNDQITRLELGDSAFGDSVAIDQGTLIVGEPDQGSAFLYSVNDSGENFIQELFPNNVRGFYGTFGEGVGISNDYAVVGYPGQSEIYIYQLVANVWTQVQVLSKPNDIPEFEFGRTLAIQGNIMVVGVEQYDSGDDIIREAAYVYELVNNSWVETALLIEAPVSSRFISAVATDGNTIVLGSRFNRIAYIYQKNGNTWEKQQTLLSPSNLFDNFGVAVAVENSTIVVGNNADENGTGVAYVYEEINDWALTNTLTGANSTSFDGFGSSVGISNDLIAVASYQGLENSKTVAHTFRMQSDGFYTEDNAFETSSAATTEMSSMSFNEDKLVIGFGGSLNILNADTGTTLSLDNNVLALEAFKLYPNPTSANLQVSFEKQIIKKVLLKDLNGTIVLEKDYNERKINISVANLPTGIYMAYLQTNKGTSVRKVVKI